MISRRRVLLRTFASAGAYPFTRFARAQAPQVGAIRIGLGTALSGPFAIIGNDIHAGAQFAVDLLNRKGGAAGRPIELVVKDTKTNPNDAVAAAREFLGEGVKFIVGGLYGAEAAGQIPIVAGANGIYIIEATQGMAFTHESFARNMFRTSENSVESMAGFTQIALDRYPNVTNWVYFGLDSAVNRAGADVFNKVMTDAYARVGKTITFHDPIWVKLGAGDFRNELSAIMGSSIEGMCSQVTGADGITCYTQARALGLQNKIKVIYDQGNEIGFAKAMKQNVPPNMWVSTPWYHGLYPNDPISNAIYDAYLTKTNDRYPQGWLHFGAAPVFALARGIEAAGGSTDPDKIIAALESGVEFHTMKGPAHIRKEDHQIVADLNYINYAPAPEEPGFKIADMIKLDGAKYLEPASPGKPYVP